MMSTNFNNNPAARKNVHFLHIGKTGGTVIRSALQNCLYTQHYTIQLHGHNIKLVDIPIGEKVVFFLRDPITRFVSGFYSRKRKGRPRYNAEWGKNEVEIFTAFSTPNELAVALYDESSPNHYRAFKGMHCIMHLTSYFDWINDLEYFRSRLDDIMFIGFQETLEDDFETLKTILNLPDSISLPDDDISTHRNPVNLDTSLEDDAICALRKWYANDIELVSVCKKLMSSRKM